jgi:molybdopterin-biosynthesis enzyme MoeA-like protein
MNFYTVIIGTELLNGRRNDAHFEFVNAELLKRGWEQKASFVISDEPSFIEDIFELVKKDKNSVMFCFGGIGSTPDDYTRVCASNAFRDGKMEVNENAKKLILDRFGDEAYPHRIKMADLPVRAGLLTNVVNTIPGFSIDDRFFFTPGFPNMAQSMVIEALDRFYPKGKEKYRKTLLANCSENELIPTMDMMDSEAEMSSLPMMKTIGNKVERTTEISVASYDENTMNTNFEKFVKFLEKENISYKMI